MGNAESTDQIKNIDKRSARRQYSADFANGIEAYKAQRSCESLVEGSRGYSPVNHDSWGIKVCIRKRPLFEYEKAAGEFDCITCHGNQKIVVHNAKMHSDMRQQLIDHNEFHFSQIYDDSSINSDVYLETVGPLVNFAVVEGGLATCMMYGQTGSGKVH